MARRDAETQSRKEEGGEGATNLSLARWIRLPLSSIFFLLFFLCVFAGNLSCRSTKSTDLRSLTPADALVYLETNDLGGALQPIIDSRPFNEVAKYKPDLSALKGVQLAVAVTGFETSEEKLTDEHSIGRIQPHFVAIADTHAWNYQAVGFAEKKLGSFVEKIYDSQPTLEKTDKNGGKFFTWTAADRRKAYALVIDSLIYFGNDETSIDKCLAVRRGEADSIIKTGKIQPADPATLASGYVSTDGIAQIANIVGLRYASEASDESEIQTTIAGILPQLLRNSITEITWTANRSDDGVVDLYSVTLNSEISETFNKTFLPSDGGPAVEIFAPSTASSVTRYGLMDHQAAWRSLLLGAQKETDPLSGRIIGEFSNLFFEPYGIDDPGLFLEAVASNVMTVSLDDEGEKLIVIAAVGDYEKMKRAVSKDIDFSRPPSRLHGEEMWQSSDGTLVFARQMGFVLIGDYEDVQKCVEIGYSTPDMSYINNFRSTSIRKSPIASIQNESGAASVIVSILSEKKQKNAEVTTRSIATTRFTKIGIERQTISDFGLIGWIIVQLSQD